MTTRDIALLRLHNQQIEATHFKQPPALVGWMGAMQAQDYPMAKYAIGSRIPGVTDEMVEKAISKGAIIRTHVLRPTWHFVAPEDVRWMLRLTAPYIRTAMSSMNRMLELDNKVFSKTNKLLVKSLSGNKQLTRQEFADVLRKSKIETNPQRLAHIMSEGELSCTVCNGARKGSLFTYALMDERIPSPGPVYKKDEALAELAKRYFTSHGPATVKDFGWWSGLPAKEARLGLELVKDQFVSEIVEDQEYWLAPSAVASPAARLHLLPAFDEFLVSYKDRSASVPAAHKRTTMAINGLLSPTVVVNGKVVALWKSLVQKNGRTVVVTPFPETTRINKRELTRAVREYGTFLNEKVMLEYSA
jgi:hypothetical protein